MLKFFDSYIRSSKSLYGAVFYVSEFSEAIIQNSEITGSLTAGTIFDISTSIFTILDSKISNNLNNMFLLTQSKLILLRTAVLNHSCFSKIQGCIIFAQLESNITIVSLKVNNVTSITDDLILVISSHASFNELIFELISSEKEVGSCIGSVDSIIYLKDSNFKYYLGNCLNFKNSNIFSEALSLSYNLPNMSVKNNGAFFCINCDILFIINSTFENNKNVNNGAGIYLARQFKSEPKNLTYSLIQNSIFVENEVFKKGGAIFIENEHLIIESSIFKGNKGIRGGGIFNFIEGNLLKSFPNLFIFWVLFRVVFLY